MTILLIAIAVAVTGVPLAAVVLVSFASLREESLHSVAGRAPGLLERTARRLLAFHAEGIRKPTSLAQSLAAQLARQQTAAALKPAAPVR
jgi:hypothetical protein